MKSVWPEHRSWRGIHRRLLFSYTIPLLHLGTKQVLEHGDLPYVCAEDSANVMGAKIAKTWAEELKRPVGKRSFFRALRRADHFASYFFFLAGGTAFQLTAIELLREFLIFLGETSPDWTRGTLIGLGMVAAVYCSILVFHYAWFMGQVKGMRLRVAAMSVIFDKVLRVPLRDLPTTTPGRLINICSNDVEYIQDGMKHIPPALLAPFEVPVMAGLLWREVGVASLVGIALIFFVFLPLQLILSSQYKRLRHETAEITDKRVKTMGEIIVGIRTLKAYAWEDAFESMVKELRQRELAIIRKTAWLKGTVEGLYEGMGVVLAFGCFCTFVLLGNQLTSPTVFVSLSLCGALQNRMGKAMSIGIRDGTNCYVSCKRIEKFLLQAEEQAGDEKLLAMDTDERSPLMEAGAPSSEKEGFKEGFAVADGVISWTPGEEPKVNEPLSPRSGAILSRLSFGGAKGELVAIVGKVGSGKTSILLTLARELGLSRGTLRVPPNRAIVEQEPWIQSGTVRQNILFGREFDQDRYNAVIAACALEEDLRQLHNGDLTLVGDNGVTLSGGQRARLCLARAAYGRDAGIFLLDDPLAAVDAEVGRHIFNRCICGIMADTTRVLVTHQVQYVLEHPDCTVVVLDETTRGIAAIGKSTSPQVRKLLQDMLERTQQANAAEAAAEGGGGGGGASQGSSSNDAQGARGESSTQAAFLEESKLVAEVRQSGGLAQGVVVSYMRAAGGVWVCTALICFWLIFHASYLMVQYYFSVWALDTAAQTAVKYTGGAAGFVIGTLILGIGACVAMGVQLLTAPKRLHNEALRAILSTPVLFFDSNPAGRILNRFAKDLGTMDNTLPIAVDEFFSIFCKTILSIVLAAAINPYVLLAVLPLCAVFYRLRHKFILSARELKRLESVSRSPIYAHIGEAMAGLVTIRSLRMQERFAREFKELVDRNVEAYYSFISTSRWLSTRLETLNTLFLLVCVVAALLIKGFGSVTSVGLAGLALTNLMGLGERFQWMVRLSAEIETHLVSAERIQEYCALPLEAPRETPEDTLAGLAWPEKGQLRFEHYSVRYRPDLPLVLRELTCDLPGGARIAVVGRTGAGKSSLVRALFRLVEPCAPTPADHAEFEGRIGHCWLDGIDIGKLGLKRLRRSMSIIPQSPWLFAGSFRYNLDPFNEFSDAEILTVLRDVQLVDDSEQTLTLDSPVAEGGANFSTGQRQLACLARALLSHSRVIVCDEATANVDPATDAIIQRVLREKFVGRTVITIAHRLSTIIDNDIILVLQHGKLAEKGHPFELLGQPQSVFKAMVDESGAENAESLLSTCRATWQRLQQNN